MASHHGLLPASKEVVLEIQLNKLINDFLFSGVEDRMAASVRNADAEGQDGFKLTMPRHQGDPSWNVDNPSWEMDNPVCLSHNSGNLEENVGNESHPSSVEVISNTIPTVVNGQRPRHVPSETPEEESTGMMSNRKKTTEEVRLDISEQNLSFGNVDKPQHTNKLKVFRLSRAHSVAGSLFCFAMERRGQQGERKEEEQKSKGSIKLTRIGSLPCHSKLQSEAEKEFKHTCRKPPRPPRSISEEGCPGTLLSRQSSTDAIFVLHSTSRRRARLERRRKLAASSSSSASMWALIFTFCFAMAMIGEGFWSQSSPILAAEPRFNATSSDTGMEKNTLMMLSLGRPTQSSPHISSQLEREIQMRDFWISKGLDPT